MWPRQLRTSDSRTPGDFGGRVFEKILPVLVLCAALAFSAVLLSFVREPVFYNGDGGMKLLVTQQFAKASLRANPCSRGWGLVRLSRVSRAE